MPRRLRRAWGSVGAGRRPRPLSGVDGACRRIRRGRPACRPVGGSRAEVCPGGHIGPPLHGVEGIPNQRKIGAKTDLANGAGQSPPPTGATEQGGLRRGVVTPPYGSATGDAQQRADVGIGPYGEKGKSHQPPRPAAHSGAFAVRMGGMGGNRSRDHPQNVQQRRTIPQSRPLAVPAPFTQGSLWGRGMRIAALALRASSQ